MKVKALLLQRFALCKFHVTDDQKMLDQITTDRKSKRVWSKCVLCIPYILSGNPKEYWLYTCTCDTYVITTWRLGLRAALVTRNYFAKFLSAPRQNQESSQVDCCVLILGSRFLQDSSNRNGLCLQLIIMGFVLSVICSLLSILDCCENLTTLVQVLAIFGLLSHQKNLSTV